jgi:Cytochrome c554 and c-prime
MKILKSLALLALAGLVVLAYANVARADDDKAAPKVHAYVGTTGMPSCKMCHSGPAKGNIYEIWAKTKHASATANLPDESKKDTKCLVCHSTGFGKGGYDPADAKNAPKFEGVGCEACHGPGGDYKSMTLMKDKDKAIAAGLIMPDSTACRTCHEGEVPKGHKDRPKFVWATMYPKIEHHLPKK